MAQLLIQRVNALPAAEDLVGSTMYIVKDTDAALAQLYFTSEDGASIRHIIDKADVADMIAAAVPESAETADRLTTARAISASGDAAWTVNFDGSADATAVLTLTEVTTAGEGAVVTFDAKGRVLSSRALVAADIPSLPGSKINSAISVDTTGNAATATSAGKLTTPRFINGEAFDGTADITINAVDSTARIAESEKGVANGVATLDGSGLIPSNQLPSYVDDVLEFANLAAFPATGESGKIYVALDTSLIYRWTGTVYLQIPGGVGLADSALKLQNARTIAITGDGTWSVNFDGSANVTAAFTLANVNSGPGEAPIPTVNAKGLVTGSRAIQASDLPTLDSTKVSSAAAITLVASDW